MDSRAGSRTTDWKTTDWNTTKVGSAYLFEKPQSGARKIPRFSDITAVDDDHAYDADCDSGARKAMKNRCQPDGDDDSAYYTDDARYKPKTIWQQRSHARHVIAASRHVGSAQPVRKLTDDWNEIRGLSYNLLFEAVSLLLIVSLIVVRIGAAFMESVGKRFDEGMPSALGYKGSRQSFTEEGGGLTGPAKKFTDRTDCFTDFTDFNTDPTDRTKLTDVRKRYMSVSTWCPSKSVE